MISKKRKTLTQKILSIVLLLTMLVSVLGMQLPAAAAEGDVTITIFHTNDMHGRLLSTFKNSVLSQIGADYVASIKKSVPNSLLVDAGDAVQGLPFASVSKGADVIRLMNAVGYDGMILGNHEFDYGKTQAMSNAKLASFPVVSANTLDSGNLFLKDVNGNNGEYFIKTVNGIKVGFFGITTPETAYKTNPSNLPGISFADPVTTATAEVAKLKAAGAQVIVGIFHVGGTETDDIATKVPGINVIIDGHSHAVDNHTTGTTLIAQTGSASANVGKVELTVNAAGTVTAATDSLISCSAATTGFTADPAVKALADEINASQQPLFSKIVGRTDRLLFGPIDGVSVPRLVETNMGNLITDAMADAAKTHISSTTYKSLPVVALENGGGVRDCIQPGYISMGQVITVLPFGNILSLKVVTPDVLYQAIENGVSKISGQDAATGKITGADGRFPQVAGMRYEYDPTKAASNTADPAAATGSRVTKIVLLNANGTDKQELLRTDTTTQIVLASNDYEVGGGDGYTMLKSLENIGEGNSLDVIVADYITKLTQKSGGSFTYPISQGRVKILSGYVDAAYTASVTVSNGANPLASADVTYSVDGGAALKGKTNGTGVLSLTDLAAGHHIISIQYNDLSADAFVSNLVGLGVSATAKAALAVNQAKVDDVALSAAVISKIDALPAVASLQLSDYSKVAEARGAYNALTANQRALVTNYATLTALETKLQELAAATTPAPTTPAPSSSTPDPVAYTPAPATTTQATAATTAVTAAPIPVAADKATGIHFDISKATLPAGVTSAAVSAVVQPEKSDVYTKVMGILGQTQQNANVQAIVVQDLKLLDQNGAPITSFTGKIKVKIPVPAGMSGNLHVYWYNPTTGTVTDMNAVVENGYLVFETDHFSYYAIAQLSSASGTGSNPKTGAEDMSVVFITGLAAAVAVLLLAKKRRA